MEIKRFLDLGADLATQISDLYHKIATLTHDDSTAKKLIDISNKKLDNASALKMSKNFLKEAAKISLGAGICEEDLNGALYECWALNDRFKRNFDFLPSLIWLLSLENQLMKIYIEVSVSISDAQLMNLFHTLVKSDQNHIDTLYEIISVLQAQKNTI